MGSDGSFDISAEDDTAEAADVAEQSLTGSKQKILVEKPQTSKAANDKPALSPTLAVSEIVPAIQKLLRTAASRQSSDGLSEESLDEAFHGLNKKVGFH